MSQFEALEILLRAGDIAAVAKVINDLNLARVAREERKGLAKICRRAGLVEKGLRVLYPVIRDPVAVKNNPPTHGELAEYSVLLSRNGSVAEALELLAEVDASHTPEALLYEGFCHVSNWDYANAATKFEDYLATDLEPYTRLIAQVNLSASYLALENFLKAEQLLLNSIRQAKDTGSARLVGNCLELLAQVHIHSGNFAQATFCIQEGFQIFGESQSYDWLLLFKLERYIEAAQKNSIAPLLKFREKALALRHWPSVRDVDYLCLRIKFEQNRFDKLVLGSPLPAYRARAIQQLKRQTSDYFDWGSGEGPTLDLKAIQANNQIHQMLLALSSDLYEPINLGRLFAKLYPDEYFNVESSPLRLRQAIRRSRNWLAENQFPLKIQHSSGAYQLSLAGSMQVRVYKELGSRNKVTTSQQQLIQAFGIERKFSLRQAMEALSLSRTSFHRLSQIGIEQGWILRIGQGKATKYLLVAPSADLKSA